MAGLFSTATLEQIRAASDVVDVIGSYLPLKKAGANFVALCPFHREKTPSFSVNPHKQFFYCYGCHKGGDVFAFVKEFENVDFPEAVRRLAERARIPLEYEKSGGQPQARHIKEQLLQIHEKITLRWQSALTNEAGGQPARDYLAKRGVPDEAVKLFRLGCAPEAWDDTVNWAKSKGYEPGLVEKAGLILRREGSDRYYDRFRGRLMFPICDEQGRVIGFSGRILTDEKTAKYVNSPETPIFTKSKVFFGLDKSKRALLEAQCAIVCEGQLDLIACYMAGVQNVVAPQGTAFTADHGRILKRYVEEVVLCFDSDAAGQNAAIHALDSLLASGLAVRVAVVPAPHDPDSFIKANGGGAFKKIIGRAEGFFDFYLSHLCAANDVSADRGRTAVLRAMAVALNKTNNQVLIDKHAQKTAFRLGVSPDAVRAEFRKAPRTRPAEAEPPAPAEQPTVGQPATPPPEIERWLLKVVLTNDDLVGWVEERLDLNWVQHGAVRRVLEARSNLHRDNAWISTAAFLNDFEEEAVRRLIVEAVSDSRPQPDPEKTLKGDAQTVGLLQRLRDEYLDREIALIQQRISHPAITESEGGQLVGRLQVLRSAKRQAIG